MDTLLVEAFAKIEKGATAHACEGTRLDFEVDRASFDHTAEKLVEACTCLANADGGFVVLGVKNDVPGPEAFSGTDRDGESFRAKIREWTTPPLEVDVEEILRSKARLLIFRVLRASAVHQDRRGAVRRRFQSECPRLSPDAIATLARSKSGHDWSAELADTPSPVEETELAPLRTRLRRRNSGWAEDSAPQLLRALGLVDGDGRLTNAGHLMIKGGERPGGLRVVYQFRRSSGAEAPEVEYLNEPLPSLLDRLVELVRLRRNTVPFNFPDGTQIELSDFPEDAVREAISNALLHRDHEIGEPVSVEHTNTSLRVHSPGPFVDGITVDNVLTHPSRTRNRVLFDAARELGLSERTGRGVDRMYRVLLRAGQPPPRIENSPSGVGVTFTYRRPRTEVLDLIVSLPEDLQEDLDALLTLFSLLSRRVVSAVDLSPLCQKPPDEIEPVLESLSSSSSSPIEPTQKTARNRHPNYRLTSSALKVLGRAVPYHRQQPKDLDAKVIAHLSDYGWINNRTLQTLFDLDLHVARRRLDALRRRGIVEKLPGAKRGPAVKYGPGPNSGLEGDLFSEES